MAVYADSKLSKRLLGANVKSRKINLTAEAQLIT